MFWHNVRRKRLEFPALKRAVREQQGLFNANVVLIEDKASGTQLIQELIHDDCRGITRYKPEGDKIMRLYAQTATIENGFVHLPETAPWLAEYLHERRSSREASTTTRSTRQLSSWTGSKRPYRAGGYTRPPEERPKN